MVVTYQHTRCPQASDLEINQYTPRYIARRLLTRQESPPLRSEALVRAKFIGDAVLSAAVPAGYAIDGVRGSDGVNRSQSLYT